MLIEALGGVFCEKKNEAAIIFGIKRAALKSTQTVLTQKV